MVGINRAGTIGRLYCRALRPRACIRARTRIQQRRQLFEQSAGAAAPVRGFRFAGARSA